MASVSGICNISLSHLGDEADIADINEASATANYCRTFFPVARDACLESHTWGFATRRVSLALLADTPPDSWLYTYAVPATALKVVSIHAPGDTSDNDSADFVQEVLNTGVKVIYTNTEDAIGRYIAQITDTTKYTALFTLALARLLSSLLAGPVIKGEAGKKVSREELQTYLTVELPMATQSDASASKNEAYNKNMVAGGISARR